MEDNIIAVTAKGNDMSGKRKFVIGKRPALPPRTLVFFVLLLFAVLIVAAAQASDPTASQSMAAPVIANCPPFMFNGYVCNEMSWDFDANPAPGCEGLTWSIIATDYQPVGVYAIDANGVFAFTLDKQDAGAMVKFAVIVTDNCGAADTCNLFASSLNSQPYLFHIGKVPALFGDELTIPITKLAGSDGMMSFEFTISHDPCILNFISADLGQALGSAGCGWEYFTYQINPEGPDYVGCQTGTVRVIGIADINNGGNYPMCTMLPDGEAIVNLHYTVGHDHHYECNFVPIRFVWNGCHDNTVRSEFGNILNTSCRVFEASNADPDTSSLYEITDTDCSELWHYGGSCGACASVASENERHFATFWNGGVDLMCDDSAHCTRGDMNVNRIAYENGDLVTYISYWFYGIPALSPDPFRRQMQICNSDVNNDGITLTVGDIVYMMRVMSGEIPAIVPKVVAGLRANLTQANGVLALTSDSEIGGILIDLKYDSGADLEIRNLTGLEMRQGLLPNGEYRVLLLPQTGGSSVRLEAGTNSIIVSGDNAEVVNVVAVDYYGNAISVNRQVPTLPTEFSLSQNSPNPFNPLTKIEIGLPVLGEWTLDIINVSGQVVKSFQGRDIGTVSVEWNAIDEPSGVYFYRVISGGFTETKKMVLLK